MCLHNNPKDVAKLLKRQSPHIIAYKVLANKQWDYSMWDYIDIPPTAPYYHQIYEKGINKSTSKVRKPILTKKEVHRGIHVYLTKKEAEHACGSMESIYRLKCLLKDLIGANYFHKEAVFSKVELLSLKPL